MTHDLLALLSGEVLDEEMELTLAELCRACRVPAERVFELVEVGVVEPLGREPGQWRFQGVSVRRVRCALRLERDLGVNTAGAALALDLLDEIEALRARLARFDEEWR
jgi:chaperone modulatory protein CbpM